MKNFSHTIFLIVFLYSLFLLLLLPPFLLLFVSIILVICFTTYPHFDSITNQKEIWKKEIQRKRWKRKFSGFSIWATVVRDYIRGEALLSIWCEKENKGKAERQEKKSSIMKGQINENIIFVNSHSKRAVTGSWMVRKVIENRTYWTGFDIKPWFLCCKQLTLVH